MPQTEPDLRRQISHLLKTDPHVHVDISLQKPKLMLQNVPATIVGVYPHIFLLEEHTMGYVRRHTLQYTDMLLRLIIIRELENKNDPEENRTLR